MGKNRHSRFDEELPVSYEKIEVLFGEKDAVSEKWTIKKIMFDGKRKNVENVRSKERFAAGNVQVEYSVFRKFV